MTLTFIFEGHRTCQNHLPDVIGHMTIRSATSDLLCRFCNFSDILISDRHTHIFVTFDLGVTFLSIFEVTKPIGMIRLPICHTFEHMYKLDLHFQGNWTCRNYSPPQSRFCVFAHINTGICNDTCPFNQRLGIQ